MYHEMTPFIVLICSKIKSKLHFEIQTANNVIYTQALNFDFKLFSSVSRFPNFSSTKLLSAFASFSNTKYFQWFVLQ